MKIAYILPSLLNRGPNVFTKYLIDALLELNYDVEVFYLRDSKREINFACKCSKLNFCSTKPLTSFDIIHTTTLRPDLYGWIHSRSLRNKWVASTHNELGTDLRLTYKPFFAAIAEYIWRSSLNRCNNIITSSTSQLNYYNNYLTKGKKYCVISYGIKLQTPKPLPPTDLFEIQQLRGKHKIIGSCGLLIPRKAHELLLHMLVTNTNLAVILIGDGERRIYLQNLAKKLGVAERFLILGFKHNHLDYYPYFDVYAHTSLSEGFGLAMIEAMSQGIPVICSDLSIYEGYFHKEDVGLFNTGDVDSLNLSLNCVLGDLAGYAQSSFNLFMKYFSSRTMALEHMKFYEGVISGKE